MTVTLSRSTSQQGVASNHRSWNGSIDGDTHDSTAIMSGPPSPPDLTKPGSSLASAGRASSHSLLSAPQNTAPPSRKSRFADAGTTGTNVARASISMPPPTTKPSSMYKPSTVRRPSAMQNAMSIKEAEASLDGTREEMTVGESNGLDELEKTTSLPGTQSASASEPHSPVGLSDTALKPLNPNLSKSGDRSSFSSLFSLGSAFYSGATGLTSAPQSTASSNAGSIKSILSEQPASTPTPLSPSLGAAAEREAASIATTATDPVSVTAHSQPLHQGLRCPWIALIGVGTYRFW